MQIWKPPPSVPAAPAAWPIHYPESDGKPAGETDFHITVIFYVRSCLRYFFRRAEKTYVAGNMLFYYEEGVPASVISPDVFVVKGIAKHDRRTYKLWEEKAVPCAAFEITSRSSRHEDQGTKRSIYEMLGIREYFLFDPLDEYLKPQLQGYRLKGETYEGILAAADSSIKSEELGLILRPDGPLLRLIDPETGEMGPTLEEAISQVRSETARAEAAETEVARLRALLAQRPGGTSSAS